MTDTQNKEDLNRAICSLYRTLAAVQFAAIDYVRTGEGGEAMKIRAQEITAALTMGMSGVQPMQRLYNADLCWDPATETYVNC